MPFHSAPSCGAAPFTRDHRAPSRSTFTPHPKSHVPRALATIPLQRSVQPPSPRTPFPPGRPALMPLPCRHLAAVAPRRFLTSTSQARPLLHALSPCAALRHAPAPPPQPWRVRDRGKKTKAAVKLDDLPQGLIPLEPLALEPDINKPFPTVVRQARSNMQKFENCVLLTRVGGFYELYFEHADEFAPLLNLKRAIRVFSAGEVPMVIVSLLPRLLMLTLWEGRLSFLPAGSLSQDSGPRSQPICCYCRGISQ